MLMQSHCQIESQKWLGIMQELQQFVLGAYFLSVLFAYRIVGYNILPIISLFLPQISLKMGLFLASTMSFFSVV